MKKWTVLAAVVALLGLSPQSQATPLPPGSTLVVPDTSAETGVATADTFTKAFDTNSGGIGIKGTIKETVFKESGGTLDFDYQIAVDAASNDAVARLTISNYAPSVVYTTSVSQFASASGFAPGTIPAITADRTSNGRVIGFNFAPMTLSPGLTSFVLIVRTNAPLDTTGTVGVIDGIPFGDSTDFFGPFGSPAPPTPEPASLLLLGGLSLGIGAMAFRRHRKGQPVVA